MATTTMTAEATAPLIAVPRTSVLNTDISSEGKPKRLHNIPTFSSKLEEQKWQKEQMAAAFRIFAKMGFADGASGHISLRDPVDPKTFWINPYAVHFGEITVSDLVQVNEEGQRVGGADLQVNAAGFIIHSEIHKARPDINAACHCHSPNGRAWSTFGKNIDMLNQDSCMFYNDVAVYQGFGGVVLATEEGRNIANALGSSHRNVILRNHGILTAGGTIAEAAAFFIALERACQTQLLVEAAVANGNLTKTFVGEEEALYTKKCTGSPECMYMQFLPEYRLVLKETKGDFLQ